MKRTILLTLFFLSLNNYAQQNEHNFILNNNKDVYWQKIYNLKGTPFELKEKLEAFFKNKTFTNDLEYNETEFVGKSVRTNVKLNKGNSGDFTCFIIIELKNNKYRVTVKDIIFEPITSGINYGGIIITSNQSNSFGYYAVKNSKNEFRKNKGIQNALKSFHKYFDKYFTYTKEPEKSNDW